MTASVTTGQQARQLIAEQLKRLENLRPDVLQGQDPEALHQFRVSLRRLRSLLSQFRPALELPPRLSRARIAALARSTGSCRDADVLREHLEQQLLPRLAPGDRQACAPLLQALKRQRHQAMVELHAELSAERTRKLLRRLDRWCREPHYSRLGLLPLEDWLREWLQACSGGCFLHAGWFAADPSDSDLHELRKRIKEVRYGLEALRNWLGEPGEGWISNLRRVQSCLGDLHDQEVLRQLIHGHGHTATALRHSLEQDRRERWEQWQQLRAELLPAQRRHALLQLGS